MSHAPVGRDCRVGVKPVFQDQAFKICFQDPLLLLAENKLLPPRKKLQLGINPPKARRTTASHFVRKIGP
jgi:hypothetical protein